MDRCRFRVLLLSLLALLASPSSAPAGSDGPREALGPEVASVTLNAYDDEINGLLEKAAVAEAKGDYEAAVRLLQDAADKATNEVHRVSKRTYLGIREYARSRIRRWPEEGLAVYRRIVDARAMEIYRSAVKRGDPSALRTIAGKYAMSTLGARAHLILGTRAVARGDLDRALHYFLGILYLYPRGPIPGVDRADVLARAALAAAKRGDGLVLEEMRARAGRLTGASTVTVAGSETPLDEFLAGLSPTPHGSYAPAGWTTVCGAPSRTGGRDGPNGPLALYWTWEIPGSHPPLATLLGGDDDDPPPIHPLIIDGLVIVPGHNMVHALKLPGPDFVPTEDAIRALYPEQPVWEARSSDEVLNSRRDLPPVFASAGDDIVVLPFRGLFEDEPEIYVNETDIEKAALVTLSISKELYCLDQRGGTDPLYPARYRDVVFSGAPVILDGRVYVSGTRTLRRVETLVFCFEQAPEPGLLRPVWTTSVCMGSGRPGEGVADRRVDASTLAAKNGVLYLCTNTGAVAALDGESGDIIWIYAYETADPRLGLFTREMESVTSWWENPVVLDHRYVYAAPKDSEYLHILFQHFQRPEEARTGDVAHAKFNAHRDVANGFLPEYVVGAQDGVVFLAGTSRGGERPLFAVKAGPAFPGFADRPGDQNRILWRAAVEEDAPCGRGVLAGEAIYFPTRKGIYRVEVADGSVVKLFDPAAAKAATDPREDVDDEKGPLRVVGNLAVAGRYLVSVTDRTVRLFGPARKEEPQEGD